MPSTLNGVLADSEPRRWFEHDASIVNCLSAKQHKVQVVARIARWSRFRDQGSSKLNFRLAPCGISFRNECHSSRTDKGSIQFFNFRHQVGIEAGNLYSGLTQHQLSIASDTLIRVKRPDNDTLDAVVSNVLRAWLFRGVSSRAWFKRCIDRCSGYRLSRELLLKSNELGVVARCRLTSMAASKNLAVLYDYNSHQRMYAVILGLALLCFFNRHLHEKPLRVFTCWRLERVQRNRRRFRDRRNLHLKRVCLSLSAEERPILLLMKQRQRLQTIETVLSHGQHRTMDHAGIMKANRFRDSTSLNYVDSPYDG